MPIVPIAPPQSVPVSGGFDYVTVDALHRRVYAAHGGYRSLLVVDADSGAIVGQVRVGPMHGVAFDPASGTVYTGNGDDQSVSEIDPATLKVTRSVKVDGIIDAIAFDASNGHIYADEDDGTRIFVIDAKTMKQIGVVTLPGHKPEYLAVDPQTHDVYQNIANTAELVSIDPNTLKVKADVKTPEMTNNHPLQYDAGYKQVIISGNGVMSVYSQDLKKLYQTEAPKGIDQCDLDQASHLLACAAGGSVTVFKTSAKGAPLKVADLMVAPGIHTIAIDAKTKNIWVVWASPKGEGDFVQRFSLKP